MKGKKKKKIKKGSWQFSILETQVSFRSAAELKGTNAPSRLPLQRDV